MENKPVIILLVFVILLLFGISAGALVLTLTKDTKGIKGDRGKDGIDGKDGKDGINGGLSEAQNAVLNALNVIGGKLEASLPVVFKSGADGTMTENQKKILDSFSLSGTDLNVNKKVNFTAGTNLKTLTDSQNNIINTFSLVGNDINVSKKMNFGAGTNLSPSGLTSSQVSVLNNFSVDSGKLSVNSPISFTKMAEFIGGVKIDADLDNQLRINTKRLDGTFKPNFQCSAVGCVIGGRYYVGKEGIGLYTSNQRPFRLYDTHWDNGAINNVPFIGTRTSIPTTSPVGVRYAGPLASNGATPVNDYVEAWYPDTFMKSD